MKTITHKNPDNTEVSVSIGNGVRINDGVSIGNDVSIRNGVRIGDRVRIGGRVRIGDGVSIGNGVNIGYRVNIGDSVRIGDGARIDSSRNLLVSYGLFVANEYSQGVVRIGCEIHSIEEWEKNFEAIFKNHSTPKARIDQYMIFIKMVKETQALYPLNGELP